MVTPAFNPSTREAEAGGVSEFEASLIYRVSSGQPELQRETLSGKTNKMGKFCKDDSEIKSVNCLCRKPEFSFQHSGVTPVPGDPRPLA